MGQEEGNTPSQPSNLQAGAMTRSDTPPQAARLNKDRSSPEQRQGAGHRLEAGTKD